MKTYKVYDLRNPRRWRIVRAKSGVQAKKKGSKWLKTPIECLEVVIL